MPEPEVPVVPASARPALSSARDTLATLLPAVPGASSYDPAPLRQAVRLYVDAAHARGDSVERVIIELKQMMEVAGVWRRWMSSKDRAIAEGVIRCCIDRYYQPADMNQR
jgi:hypothetical protein